MNILIVSLCLFIALTVIKDGFDMCKTRAEVEMIYRMCKFLSVSYLEEHPDDVEYFNRVMKEGHDEDAGRSDKRLRCLDA